MAVWLIEEAKMLDSKECRRGLGLPDPAAGQSETVFTVKAVSSVGEVNARHTTALLDDLVDKAGAANGLVVHVRRQDHKTA